MGALTSKPYAFQFRPWDTQHFSSFDFLNSYLTPIKIELFNDEIVRVLPTLSGQKNLNFLTNKARFVYDFYKTQTITENYLRTKHGQFYPVTATYINKLIKKQLFPRSNLTLLINRNFIDYLTGRAASNLLYSNLFHTGNTTKITNLSFRYFPISTFDKIEKTKRKMNFIFLDVNLRFIAPIFLLKLKKTDLINSFNIGNKNYNAKFIKNLGSNIQLELKKLLFGKIKIKKLYKSIHPLQFFVSSAINTNLNFSILKKFKTFSLIKDNFAHIFNLFQTIGETTINKRNLVEKNLKRTRHFNTIINFNSDTLMPNIGNAFKIYYGHNATLNNIESYNLIIPVKNILEDSSRYYNINKNSFIKNTTPLFITKKFKRPILSYIKFYNIRMRGGLHTDMFLNKQLPLSITPETTFLKNYKPIQQSYNFLIDNILTFSSKHLNLAHHIFSTKKIKNGF